MRNRVKADQLARKHGLETLQNRYREDGKWYHHLVKFPAALLDEHGYVIIKTEREYIQSPYLQRAQDLHVVGDGISSMPGYRLFNQVVPETKPEASDQHFPEGAIEEMTVEIKSRDAKLRTLAIQTYGTVCQVCGFDFYRVYGQLGKGYIEVHHLEPLSEKKGSRVSTVNDVAVVCANCHRMLHRSGRKAIPIETLKALIGRG